MADDRFGPDDVSAMTTPAWEQAIAAIAAGDAAAATEAIERAVARWRSLQDYSINRITSLLSFIGREMGEEAVERALRKTGDEFVRPRRERGVDWNALPARTRAKAIATAMVANFSTCDVTEDDEKITLSFACGSGGRLIDDGKYDGDDAYLTLREAGSRTFRRDELPVYCAHCSVNNEMQPVEWTGYPTTIESPPTRAGERCVHHVYKDLDAIPADVYERIGKAKP